MKTIIIVYFKQIMAVILNYISNPVMLLDKLSTTYMQFIRKALIWELCSNTQYFT